MYYYGEDYFTDSEDEQADDILEDTSNFDYLQMISKFKKEIRHEPMFYAIERVKSNQIFYHISSNKTENTTTLSINSIILFNTLYYSLFNQPGTLYQYEYVASKNYEK